MVPPPRSDRVVDGLLQVRVLGAVEHLHRLVQELRQVESLDAWIRGLLVERVRDNQLGELGVRLAQVGRAPRIHAGHAVEVDQLVFHRVRRFMREPGHVGVGLAERLEVDGARDARVPVRAAAAGPVGSAGEIHPTAGGVEERCELASRTPRSRAVRAPIE